MYAFVLMLLLFVFTGCGPRYAIQNEYIPPSNPAMQSCITTCSFNRNNCANACQQSYQYCLNDAYGRAKAVEFEELRAYDMAYAAYRMDYMRYEHALRVWQRDYYDYERDYNHFAKKCEREKDTYACHKRDEVKSYLKRINRDKPHAPWVPVRKSFEQILSEQQSMCSNQCGCESAFDRCYVGCGGQVIPHQICVQNCD